MSPRPGDPDYEPDPYDNDLNQNDPDVSMKTTGSTNQQPQSTMGSLAQGWQNWIDKPTNRAALMQFGIAMMQPVGLGQTPIGHAANALGEAGQAAETVDTQRRTEEESQSKMEERKANTEARLIAANARTDLATAAMMRAEGGAKGRTYAQQMYINATQAHNKWMDTNDPLVKPGSSPYEIALGHTKAEIAADPKLRDRAIWMRMPSELGGGGMVSGDVDPSLPGTPGIPGVTAPLPKQAALPAPGPNDPGLGSIDYGEWIKDRKHAQTIANLREAINSPSPMERAKALRDKANISRYMTPASRALLEEHTRSRYKP